MPLPSPLPNLLQYTIGSTNYSLPLVPGSGVRVLPKPQRGDVIATVGTLDAATRLDSPWVIADLKGIGVSRAVVGVTESPDERAWEMQNIMRWRGAWMLGPYLGTITDMTGVHNIIGHAEGIGNLFYFADTAAADRETLAYFVAATPSWTSCTATADWKATTTNAQFPCVGMATFVITNLSMMALRSIAINNGTAYYQLIHSTDGTTWTIPDHGAAANTPAGGTTDACVGLISWLDGATPTAATLSYNSTTKVVTLRTATSPAGTWAAATGGTLSSNSAPRALRALPDATGIMRPFVYLEEGYWYWDSTNNRMVPVVSYSGDRQANAGTTPVFWRKKGVPGGYRLSQQGRRIVQQSWPEGSSGGVEAMNISPTAPPSMLPLIRDGLVTALETVDDFLFAAIGGDSATTTAGLYMRADWPEMPQGWQGPIYDLGTANRQIRRLFFSTLDDGLPRLHVTYDNATPGDAEPAMFERITMDPRNSAYSHAASGALILPKNNRGLPDLNGVWLNITVTGTTLSATNQVSAVYASANAAALASNGSWGTTLGAITTSGGSVNFAATPTGTGQSAREMQLRIDLSGTSSASPSIEAIVVAVEKLASVKSIRIFEIDMVVPPGTQAGMTSQKRLDDIEALRDAATYASVAYGQESGLIMKMYKDSGEYMDYLNELLRAGTGLSQTDIKSLKLLLVEV